VVEPRVLGPQVEQLHAHINRAVFAGSVAAV
jgi:hypothetical protein